MTLRSLAQPFRSTFQPLPSTPPQSCPKPESVSTGKISRKSFFSKGAKTGTKAAPASTDPVPSPEVSDKGAPKSPAGLSATSVSGTFRIDHLGKEQIVLPVLVSQTLPPHPVPSRPRRLLKRPPSPATAQPHPHPHPQPGPKAAPAIAKVSEGSSRRFETWTAGSSGSRIRRANKAALALRHVLLDINADGDVVAAVSIHTPFRDGSERDRDGRGRLDPMVKERNSGIKIGQGSKKAAMVPRLRGKDVERLQTQLLKPDTAGMVIASARTLSGGPRLRLRLDALGLGTGDPAPGVLDGGESGTSLSFSSGAEPRWAVCLDVDEPTADDLLLLAAKTERDRQVQSDKLASHRYGTIKQPPPLPARLPIILSLLEAVPKLPGFSVDSQSAHAPVLPLGLMQPPSAMSLHRPLAGALPTPETLRRGFDALLNAESKVYKYQGPSHRGLYPPTDRLSVFTCTSSVLGLVRGVEWG